MTRLAFALALFLGAQANADPHDVELTTANIGNPRDAIPECADRPIGLSAQIWFNAVDTNNDYGSVEVSADSTACPKVSVLVSYIGADGVRLRDLTRNVEETPGNSGETLHLFAPHPIGSNVDQFTWTTTFCQARYVTVTVKWSSADSTRTITTGAYTLDRGEAWGSAQTCLAF